MASPVAAPTVPMDAQTSSPGPGGGFPSPAPAQVDPATTQAIQIVLTTVQGMKVLGRLSPRSQPKLVQINDLLSQVLADVKAGGPAPETQAPPV